MTADPSPEWDGLPPSPDQTRRHWLEQAELRGWEQCVEWMLENSLKYTANIVRAELARRREQQT